MPENSFQAGSSLQGPSGVAASSATKEENLKRERDDAESKRVLKAKEDKLQGPSDVAASSASLTQQPSLGLVHYRPAPGAEFKPGVIGKTKLSNSKASTILKYEGVEYPNAMEWMAKEFNNSGRACYHIIPKSEVGMGDTPRAKFYIPPNAKCGFGRYV